MCITNKLQVDRSAAEQLRAKVELVIANVVPGYTPASTPAESYRTVAQPLDEQSKDNA